MSLASEVKSLALEPGADLIGIAPVEHFEGARGIYDPDGLPDALRSALG